MPLQKTLKEKFGDAVVEIHDQCGNETAVVRRESFLEIVDFLRGDPEFDMNVLMDLTAVDGRDLKWKLRFEVVYHFYSLQRNHRLRLKVRLDSSDLVMPTLTSRWPIADWFERYFQSRAGLIIFQRLFIRP